MAKTRFSGPLASVGALGSGDSNPDEGPSYARHGYGIYDARLSAGGGSDVSEPDYLWWGVDRVRVMDGVPSTLSAVNIAAAQAGVANTALTLVAATGAGVTIGQSVVNALTGTLVTGLLALDGAMGYQSLSLYNSVEMYDPALSIARNVRITSVGNDSGIAFLVSGFDIYGFPMTELITGANAGIASGKKAFKYIRSVTPNGAAAANVSVGTGDVYGFGLRAGLWGSLFIFWNGALITSSTGFTVADATTPATDITGDTRGTYAVQSASDGAKRLEIFVTPEPAFLTDAGLFGVQQV